MKLKVLVIVTKFIHYFGYHYGYYWILLWTYWILLWTHWILLWTSLSPDKDNNKNYEDKDNKDKGDKEVHGIYFLATFGTF